MRLWFGMLVVLLLGTRDILAQSDRATITGTVKDASGALVQGARLTATDVNNNLRSTGGTNGAGRFTLLDLPIGQYTLVCTKDGFERYTRSGLHLAISEASEIDIVLTIGSKAEAVMVIGDASQLQTQTSSISTNLDNAAVTELPLNVQGGRNLSAFMFAYVPGVEGNGAMPSDKDFSSHIDGSLSDTKEVMIDGTPRCHRLAAISANRALPWRRCRNFK